MKTSLGIIGVAIYLASCLSAIAADEHPSRQASVLIRDVPHVHQKPDFCGEACAASWLQKQGIAVDQDHVFDVSGLDPILGRGCYTKELVGALRRLGIATGRTWHPIPAEEATNKVDALWQDTLSDLRNGTASIVCMRTNDTASATEHFRLILGYDSATDEVVYHEPAEANGAYQTMSRTDFLRRWPLKYSDKEWLVIRIAMRMDRPTRPSPTKGHTAADYAQHIMKLRSRLPSRDFSIRIEHPFVVIGDESPETVKRRSEQTVRWATRRLKDAYFKNDPNEILDIWLFKDKQSYEENTLRLFSSKPSTPFGYYSSSDGALVMNIATGGGTLVHEIVHPFIESNFPECPAWLNEGLGSLYEQSSSRGDRIVGLTNWRLSGLQKAISRGEVPSFRQLCGTTSNQFYRSDPGTNYAQARYLCYYLQEHGLLRTFYHRFVANHKDDPTGYETLKEVLEADDMDEFQEKWQGYVMNLRF